MKKAVLFAALVTAGVVAALPGCARDKPGTGTDSVIASTTASNTDPATRVTSADSSQAVPKSINDVGTYGEDLYDEIKTGKSKRLPALLDSLRAAARRLPPGDQLQSHRATVDNAIAALVKTITSRNRTAALEAANQATLVSAQMAASFAGPIPTGVLVLEYYGRELEIWSAHKDLARLKRTAAALTRSWNTLKPTVEAKGGGLAAARTDSLVARVNAAKSPADYATITPAFLDEVDVLEKVFTKQ